MRVDFPLVPNTIRPCRLPCSNDNFLHRILVPIEPKLALPPLASKAHFEEPLACRALIHLISFIIVCCAGWRQTTARGLRSFVQFLLPPPFSFPIGQKSFFDFPLGEASCSNTNVRAKMIDAAKRQSVRNEDCDGYAQQIWPCLLLLRSRAIRFFARRMSYILGIVSPR